MKKNLLLLLFSLIIIQLNKAQQIGEGMAPVISNFNTGLMSGGYNGCASYGLTGGVPDESSVWQHLLTIRHPNSTNNYQLQLGATFEQNDRLFFRKIATGNNDGVSDWNEVATRGSNTFNGMQIFNSKIGIGTITPVSDLEIANSSGAILSLSTNKINGSSGTPLLPSIDFLGYLNGKKVRLSATEESYDTYGSRFLIQVNDGTSSTSLKERFTILSNGNIGIGTSAPNYKLDITGVLHVAGNSELFGPSYKIYGNSDANNYYIGHYAVTGSDGLDIHWYGGIRFGDYTGNVLQISNGLIGIGTTTPQNKLDVNGTIHAREVKVDNNNWPDFVFAPTYNLRPLGDVESFIKANGHLPEVPKATDVQQNGVNLGEMQTKLLQKVEELTLYSIEQEKKNSLLQQELEVQKTQYWQLLNEVNELKTLIKK